MARVICEHCSSTVIMNVEKYFGHLSRVHKIELDFLSFNVHAKVLSDKDRILEQDQILQEKNNRRELAKSKHKKATAKNDLFAYDAEKEAIYIKTIQKLEVENRGFKVEIKQIQQIKDDRTNGIIRSYRKDFDEERQKFEAILKGHKNAKYKIQYEDLKKKYDNLVIIHQLTNVRIQEVTREKIVLEEKYNDVSKRLENAQRVFKNLNVSNNRLTPQAEFKPEKNAENERSDRSLGDSLDGSYGLYGQRENGGKWGSLSSYDNYGEEGAL